MDKAEEALSDSSNTGQIGNGKISGYGNDHAGRIRTGETETDAL